MTCALGTLPRWFGLVICALETRPGRFGPVLCALGARYGRPESVICLLGTRPGLSPSVVCALGARPRRFAWLRPTTDVAVLYEASLADCILVRLHRLFFILYRIYVFRSTKSAVLRINPRTLTAANVAQKT